MMTLLLPILAIVLLFSLSIFVHELGHFIAARLLGMVADVFSIGMGPALWKRRFGSTVWKIGAIPFGGYVALPQMDPNSFLEGTGAEDRGQKTEDRGQRSESGGQEPEVRDPTSDVRQFSIPDPRPRTSDLGLQNLPRVAPWKKIIVSLAGAFGNVVFAFALAAIVWAVGKPSSLQERNAIIGYVATDSAAAEAGLTPGDEVLSIDGQTVANWMELTERVALAASDDVRLLVRTPEGDERDVTLTAERLSVGIRMLPGLDGMDPCHVAAVFAGSGAEAAGLQAGDQILRFDGQAVFSRAHLSQLVEASSGRSAEIVLRRDGTEVSTWVSARFEPRSERYLIGIQFNLIGDLDFETRAYPTPWAQVKSHAGAIFRFLRALTTPATSGAAADAVGGPVLILIMLWHTVRSSIILAVWFTGFLNVNLAILNLLPIPILDGGHVVLNLYEWGARRPAPKRLVNLLANVFAILLLGLFLLLTFRDVVRQVVPGVRHWMGAGHQEAEPPVFAPEELPVPAEPKP